jgi:manganese transport protein
MNKMLEVFLGILTAMGGFVEIGEMVFALNAGAKFRYSLLWIVPVGTLGIIIYGEIAGRIAAITKQPIFDLIRERVGFNAGFVTLLAGNIVCILTCIAEVGGVAMVLQHLFNADARVMMLCAFIILLGSVWILPFKWIERVYGLLGLLMAVFILAAIQSQPDWKNVSMSFLPNIPSLPSTKEYLVYAYFGVSFLSSIMLPYETYFYASGAIEDHWNASHIKINRVIVILGFILGSLLAAALLILGAQLFHPRNIEPQLPGSGAIAPFMAFGTKGLVFALLGMFFAFGGAAIETCLSSAYNLAQFFGWPWGKFRKPSVASRFTLSWIIIFVLALIVNLIGIDPVAVVEYSIVFSVIILPLSYFPLLIASRDPLYMDAYASGKVIYLLGWAYLILLSIGGLAAIPLMILTHGGKG